ncbi:recombination protein O N-terminal domain-containing protein [Alistipes sp. OttesenSCG-928-B03]|nr:recombination protein O N-terminal domain-containing protein [Alistipes sp. OttesenSCG-928-B03]
MKSYKARGVVLHTLKYGENSMVVFMLTDAHGRQSYMVQGVRSQRGKGNRAALYQPMFVLDMVGLESPKMQMHRIREVRSAFPLATLPFDVRKSTISLFMAETLYRLVKEVEPRSPLFDFVCDAVAALDAVEDGVANFHLWFLVRLSAYLGFYPGNEYEQGSVFDIEEGLFVLHTPRHGLAVNPDNSRILGELMDADVASLAEIKLGRVQRSDFLTSMLTYFGYHLDAIHHVRSIQILRDVF